MLDIQVSVLLELERVLQDALLELHTDIPPRGQFGAVLTGCWPGLAGVGGEVEDDHAYALPPATVARKGACDLHVIDEHHISDGLPAAGLQFRVFLII